MGDFNAVLNPAVNRLGVDPSLHLLIGHRNMASLRYGGGSIRMSVSTPAISDSFHTMSRIGMVFASDVTFPIVLKVSYLPRGV